MRENEPIKPAGGPNEPGSTTRWRTWALVVVLLGVPGALYTAVSVVAFLPLTTAQKIGVFSGLVVEAEVVLWGAALFVGRAMISRYRRFFDPRARFEKG